MLQDPEIDVVAIVTPRYERATMGIYAALHEKHVTITSPTITTAIIRTICQSA